MRRPFPIFLILLAAISLPLLAWLAIKPARGGPGSAAPDSSITLPPSRPGNLRIMTANIRISDPADGDNAWTLRRDLVLKTFLKYQPDLIACQEVSPAQGAFLNKELAGNYSYYPRPGIGTLTAAPAGPSSSGTAAKIVATLGDALATLNTLYFRSDRFDVIDGEAGLILPEQPQPTASENTFFTLAILREKSPSAAPAKTTAPESPAPATPSPHHLIVIDIHFRHGEPFAIQCATRLREKLAAWQNKFPDADILLAGDINHDRTEPLYPYLTGTAPQLPASLRQPPLADTFDYAKKPPATPWGTFHNFTGNSDRAFPTDLIFYHGHLAPAPPPADGAQILRDHSPTNHYPSDHFFVLADLQQNP